MGNKEAKTMTKWAREMAMEAMKRNKSLEDQCKNVILKLDSLMKKL